MTWDLEAAKARLGITDNSQDAAIESAMGVALALAEKYCDRQFLLELGTVQFPPTAWPVLLVRRYPIKDVVEVLAPNGSVLDPTRYGVDYEHGMIRLGWGITSAGVPPGSSWWSGSVAVTFEGGYDPLPADLEAALWMVFDNVWSTTPGMGLPAGSATSSSGGAVRSFSIDGMSIGYDNSATSGGGGSAAPDDWGLIPALATAILNFYRAETVVGGA
jgi:Phage gp6-like head-tail connector protein